MKEHILYLLLGSNLGDRETNLSGSIRMTGEKVGSIVRQSSLYETESWGFAGASFLNKVVCLATRLSPEEVLEQILEIEQAFGRTRSGAQYQSRTLDIDILFYDDLIFNNEKLKIPHVKLTERRFVLVPLNEIAPDLIHPESGRSVTEILAACQDQGLVTKVNERNM